MAGNGRPPRDRARPTERSVGHSGKSLRQRKSPRETTLPKGRHPHRRFPPRARTHRRAVRAPRDVTWAHRRPAPTSAKRAGHPRGRRAGPIKSTGYRGPRRARRPAAPPRRIWPSTSHARTGNGSRRRAPRPPGVRAGPPWPPNHRVGSRNPTHRPKRSRRPATRREYAPKRQSLARRPGPKPSPHPAPPKRARGYGRRRVAGWSHLRARATQPPPNPARRSDFVKRAPISGRQCAWPSRKVCHSRGAAKPARPAPRAKRMSIDSTTSSKWCAVAITRKPNATRCCAKNSRRAERSSASLARPMPRRTPTTQATPSAADKACTKAASPSAASPRTRWL